MKKLKYFLSKFEPEILVKFSSTQWNYFGLGIYTRFSPFSRSKEISILFFIIRIEFEFTFFRF